MGYNLVARFCTCALSLLSFVFFFFFQAEDGIRDKLVTGVQTCALPISKFGSAAKPLACRVYPFMLVPAGDHWRIGLRFACPEAAAGRGRPLGQHIGEIGRASCRERG